MDKAFRALLWLVVASAGVIFWLAPHPPMSDLPQHAGQVAILHDLLTGTSPWQADMRFNWFTPYLIGYALALALSFVMPVTVALKLLLTLAYYSFVAAGVHLRKRFGGDARLDWLFVPVFFGYAYEYGFFTFLVAAPLGLLYVLLARQYAEQPSGRAGAKLLAAGVGLFFSHGLVFLFANAIGVAFVVATRARHIRQCVATLWPYALLGALCLAYAAMHREVDLAQMYPFSALWGPLWLRPVTLFVTSWGMTPDIGAAMLASIIMFATPWLMGLRPRRQALAWVPMATTLVVWLGAPIFALNTFMLYQRFALFILPFYALMFRDAGGDVPRRRTLSCQVLMAGVCVIFLSAQAKHAQNFARESADFDAVMSAAVPARRALFIVFDKASPAAGNPTVYENFPAWYQAERQGLVDFNFAWFPPQIVRYRLDRLPAVRPADVGPKPFFEAFDWTRSNARIYRYFFVRHLQPLPPGLFENNDCPVTLRKSVGHWDLFENTSCH